MPVIELWDPWGMRFIITSNVNETIKAWFGEILPRVNFMPESGENPRIQVHALTLKDGSGPDWPVGSANGFSFFFAKTADDAMEELEEMRSKGPWPYGR